jgi:cytoskeletal protein RodZ
VTVPETNGPGEPPRELSVSTAPPAAPRRWWSAVPHHLGRARTSTVVLVLLFVGLYTLYLYVRPPEPAGTVPATDSTVQTPVAPAPVLPTETAEPTTTAPTTTPRTTAPPTTTPPGGTAEQTPPGTAESTPEPTAEDEPAPTTAVPTATGAPGT